MLFLLCAPFLSFRGFIHFGARPGHNAIELIFLLRLLLEKAMEWQFGLIIVSFDPIKAFDSLSVFGVVRYLVEDAAIPIRLRFALLKELLGPRKSRLPSKVLRLTVCRWSEASNRAHATALFFSRLSLLLS